MLPAEGATTTEAQGKCYVIEDYPPPPNYLMVTNHINQTIYNPLPCVSSCQNVYRNSTRGWDGAIAQIGCTHPTHSRYVAWHLRMFRITSSFPNFYNPFVTERKIASSFKRKRRNGENRKRKFSVLTLIYVYWGRNKTVTKEKQTILRSYKNYQSNVRHI